MANIKIANLPDATAVASSDYLILDQSDATKKIKISELLSSLSLLSSTELSESSGFSLIGKISDLDEMRSMTFTTLGEIVNLQEHTSGSNIGGGLFYVYSLTNSDSLVDDNGCQIITTSGQVLRRKDFTNLYSDMFGLIPGGDFDACINNMFLASRTFHIEEAWICHMGRDNPKPRSMGGNVFDLSDGMSFYVKGVGGGRFGSSIVHAGNNICMRFRRDYTTSKEFWISGGVEGLRVIGQGDSWSGSNSYPTATAIEISDLWGATLKDIFISGYIGNTSGSAISLYNDTGWTEGTILEDIIIRQSVNGLWLHRNKSTGSTATDSFFKTVGSLDINAGVSGTAINYVKIGDGTSAGKCLLYGHDLTITGWMSNGSWHNGILITDYSSCVNGNIRLNWDGYGIRSSASSEVIHLLRLGGTNAKLDCTVINTSGQENGYPLSMLQLIGNSCMYLNDNNLFEGTLNSAFPILRPKGLVMKFKGTFTQAECVSGLSYTLTALLPGQRLRVRLYSWNNNSKYQTVEQEWDVHVRGTDFPCIVRPIISSGTSLSTSSSSVVSSLATTTDTFMKTTTTTGTAVTTITPTNSSVISSASLTTSQVQVNGTFGTSLTLTNGQSNNSISYLANSGRKISFVLPADTDATQSMPYQVEIEVM